MKIMVTIVRKMLKKRKVAGEEWGENEKDWVEKVDEKKMAAVFSYDRARGSR